MKFAGVIVDISHEKLDKTFQYFIPKEYEDTIDIGTQVEIPFHNRVIKGYVVDISTEPEYEIDKIKPIKGIVKNSLVIDGTLIKLAWWMKTRYGSTVNQALKTVIPVKDKIQQETQKTVKLLISEQEAIEQADQAAAKKYVAQERVLRALVKNPVTEYSILTQKLNIAAATMKTLEKKKFIKIDEITVFRNSMKSYESNPKGIILNEEQKKIVTEINQQFDTGDLKPCLIKGITGSGKTEVYLEIIAHMIATGRQAIVLIPEIALTYQTVMRFYNRFGDKVSIIHSRLSKGEKYDRFLMAKKNKIQIMIGPRSALFTPFQNLGLIIIDEEHENAYKSENVPKYHARETAIELARLNQGKVILGSATPSIQAFYRTTTGEYHLFKLDNRAGAGRLPNVEVVDLRDEMKKGNRSIFSDKLADLIEDRLKKNQQIMLFLNRRGYQGFINCRDCGHVVQCPHCAVSLTQHKGGKLVCHYCGYQEPYTKTCPKCGSKHIGTFKAGTQKVQEETERMFPKARILRMDQDTTKGKNGHENILSKFANHEADILIGTQMIVKGHDFSEVTLVGILLADMSLYTADFTSAERTFQLLTQAAGRAGRGKLPGEVVIQTYDPDNYSIQFAKNQDYEGFYAQEIEYRSLMDYPPINFMMSIKIGCAQEEKAIQLSYILKELWSEDEESELKVIGPSDGNIYKINDIFYRMIYYKHRDYNILIEIKDRIEKYLKTMNSEWRDCQVQFDFR